MEDMNFIYYFGILVFAYLLGSIPFGLVFTRIFTSADIRQEGSGNIGATNVRRIAGTSIGLATLAGDVLKGVVPVYLATTMSYSSHLVYEIFICLTALCAFSGHLYPVYMKFKNGGKGVATGCSAGISAGCTVKQPCLRRFPFSSSGYAGCCMDKNKFTGYNNMYSCNINIYYIPSQR